MAEVSLNNSVTINGNYGDSSTPVTFSSNSVLTTIVDGLTVTKSADKEYWVDGPLTYTITIENNSGGDLESGKLTDVLNTALVNFNTEYGVMVNDSALPTSDFTYESGTLTVTLPSITGSETTTVKFQVTRVS